METRKIQEVGGGTYTVSVPKDWAERHGLRAGAEVHLFTHTDGSVVVRSDGQERGALAATDVAVDGPARVRRTLAAAHGVGFESVTLTGDFDEAERQAARDATQNLVGTVRTDGPETITVRNLLVPGDVSVRQSVVQLSFVARSLHRGATDGFLAADAGAHDELRDRLGAVRRLSEIVTRHFNRSLCSFEELDRLGASRAELFDYYATARELERVADRATALSMAAETLDGSPARERAATLRRTAESARNAVDDATTAVLDGDPTGGGSDAAHAALAAQERVRTAVEVAHRDLADGPGAAPLARALVAVEGTAAAAGAIAEVALRSAMRPSGVGHGRSGDGA